MFPATQVTALMGAIIGIRGLVMAVAPLIGSALYEAGGFTVPYVILGSVNSASLCQSPAHAHTRAGAPGLTF